MGDEKTFAEMVEEEITHKEGFHKFIKETIINNDDIYYCRPFELLAKVGRKEGFNHKAAWKTANKLKKELGLKMGITPEMKKILHHAERCPPPEEVNPDDSLKYIDRVNEMIDILIRWCYNLHIIDKNKEETAFYNRCMMAGDLSVRRRNQWHDMNPDSGKYDFEGMGP